MFNNPFTPDSHKAKKSLFQKEAKSLKLLAKEKIKEIDKLNSNEKIKFGDFEIKRDQVEFLNDLAQQIVADAKAGGQDINIFEAKLQLHQIFKSDLMENAVDADGNIKKLVIMPSVNYFHDSQIMPLHDIKISALPKSIARLKNLTESAVAFNNLETLPDSIGRLKHLKLLHLSNNPIKILPESLAQLKNLEKIYVAGTKIKNIVEIALELPQMEIHGLNGDYLDEIMKKCEEVKFLKFIKNIKF